jgi:hypothetical protein
MSTEQNIQPRLLEPGYNIIQGRGGQALVLDTNGNIFLTSPNKPDEQQSELSVNKSLSSIAIMSNTGSIINTSKKYPSNNFNLIDQEQTLEDNKVIIQSTPSTSSSDLDIAVDISPTSSVTSSIQNQIVEEPKSNKEIELEFLPEIEETEFSRITDSDIEGVPITKGEPLKQTFIPLGISNASEFSSKYKSENKCNVISKGKKSFVDVFKLVVNNLEGLYFHPLMLNDGRVEEKYRTTYQSSGETLFGLDRKQGSQDENAKKFWAKVDSFKPNGKPKWRYNTLGNLNQTQINELYTLGYKVIQPSYNTALNKIPAGLKTIIESDGRLLFSFIYGVWNGSGWYAGYLKLLTEAYNKGIINPDDLLKKHIDDRKNPQRIYPNLEQYALNIQIKSGYDLEKLTGLNCTR